MFSVQCSAAVGSRNGKRKTRLSSKNITQPHNLFLEFSYRSVRPVASCGALQFWRIFLMSYVMKSYVKKTSPILHQYIRMGTVWDTHGMRFLLRRNDKNGVLSPLLLYHPIEARFNRKALAITDTELKLIASAAIIGESRMPKTGNNTPAAMGTPSVL